MLKAIRGLPDKEQEVVLEYLVELGLSTPERAAPPSPGGRSSAAKGRLSPEERFQVAGGPIRLGAEPESWVYFAKTAGGPGPGHQMVPLRLAEPQYHLLKEWCAEHGFSMAVVLRGLVERFLEQQGERAA